MSAGRRGLRALQASAGPVLALHRQRWCRCRTAPASLTAITEKPENRSRRAIGVLGRWPRPPTASATSSVGADRHAAASASAEAAVAQQAQQLAAGLLQVGGASRSCGSRAKRSAVQRCGSGVHAASAGELLKASSSPASRTSRRERVRVLGEQAAHHGLGVARGEAQLVAPSHARFQHARPACARSTAASALSQRMALRDTSARMSSTLPVATTRPVGQHRHARGQRLGFLQVVRGEHDGAALARAASRTLAHKASRACTSRPTVGSSRNSTRGRPQMASANCTCRFWPPDSLP
jgi:hypothetical protein